MSLSIFVTDEATEDALTIAEYLAEQSSLNTSDKFLSATTQAYRTLAQMPGIGVLRTYNNTRLAGMRMLRVPKFPNYLIFYLAADTNLTILRVLHGSQSLDGIFTETGEEGESAL